MMLDAQPSDGPRAAPSQATAAPARDIVRPAVRGPIRPDAADDEIGPNAGRRKLTRTVVNFWLDALLLIMLSAYGAAAAIVYLVFPAGTTAAGWSLWGLDYDQWCGLQFGILCVFAIGILIHVMLHWTWVCSVLTRNLLGRTALPDNGTRTLYGVGLLIVLLHLIGGLVLLAQFMILEPS